MSSRRRKKPKKSKKRRPVLSALSALFGLAAAVFGGFILYCVITLPPVAEAFRKPRPPTVTFLDNGGGVVAVRGGFRSAVTWPQLPESLIQATLATEDRRFFSHHGFDLIGIARATLANIKSGRVVQGASTITQQLAKNLFLTPRRSLLRKGQELILALWLEARFSKEEILTLYFNRVYMGAGSWGMGAASQVYFKKHVSNLSLYESALLAGLLKAPSRYSLAAGEGAHGRALRVLDKMEETGYITAAQKKSADKTSIPGRNLQVGYFLDWIAPRVRDYVGAVGRDLVVQTTLNSDLQAFAVAALAEALAANRKSAVSQGAFLLMGTNGEVVAMVGGKDYRRSQFNRATQARRQPASAFKPVVYLAAIENGSEPGDTILDAPLTVGNWSPRNFDGRYAGNVTLAEALANSLNAATVRLSEKTGRQKILKTSRRLGIISDLPNSPSIALGAASVTLTELAAAYATIAGGGFAVWPWGIRSIGDAEGEVLYERRLSGVGRVIRPDDVAKITGMLAYAVKNGTAKNGYFGYPMAAKTGTSQRFRDAWFVGFTKEYTAAAWVGNDDNSPMKSVTGGSVPAGIWRRVMTRAHRGLPKSPL